jgi:hypothetical protein
MDMNGAVHQKEFFMSKVSIDLHHPAWQTWPVELAKPEQILPIMSGCMETLRRLGKLAEFVEAIRVTFARYEYKGDWSVPGPSFTFYFHDPLGNKCSHGTDYRFIGSGDRKGNPMPTSEEIVNYLFSKPNDLARFITEHINRGKQKMVEAQVAFEKLGTE